MVSHAADDPGAIRDPAPSGRTDGHLISPHPEVRQDRAVHGTVIMGRYLEPGPLQRINDMTGYHADI